MGASGFCGGGLGVSTRGAGRENNGGQRGMLGDTCLSQPHPCPSNWFQGVGLGGIDKRMLYEYPETFF